jgi:hypothetical protein
MVCRSALSALFSPGERAPPDGGQDRWQPRTGAVRGAAGICIEILRVDARLAAEETAASAAWPVGETVHSFARSGRSALLVMVNLDRRGRVVEASAYDPDEYS